jgi:hypothetical protein
VDEKPHNAADGSSGLNADDTPPALPNPAAFAPANPTDNREPLDWESKYPPDARRDMWIEGIYLAVLLIAIPLLSVALWLEVPKRWFGLRDQEYAPVLKYGLAWLGGLLGGTLFSLKWLYHSVARQIWHVDRRLWRMFTPHISGGLAFAVIALVSSGVFRIFDRGATSSRSLVMGVAFLVGYFSDSAIAKLTEIAETVFGASRGREDQLDPRKRAAAKRKDKELALPKKTGA